MREPRAIGIVGGMSPESTVTYYQRIVRRHQAEFRDHSYPRICIASVSFQRYIEWQHQGDWNRIAEELSNEFRAVAKAGADFAILATNTMHKVLPQIDSPIPVLSILDAVAQYAGANKVKSIGLTGTKFTMSDGFYAEGLESRGLKVLLPSEVEQNRIHAMIYNELISGVVNSPSAQEFAGIAQGLVSRGADATLLGCTELRLLMNQNSIQLPFIDSTEVHADAAWEMSVGK